jgi:hypothetical protein
MVRQASPRPMTVSVEVRTPIVGRLGATRTASQREWRPPVMAEQGNRGIGWGSNNAPSGRLVPAKSSVIFLTFALCTGMHMHQHPHESNCRARRQEPTWLDLKTTTSTSISSDAGLQPNDIGAKSHLEDIKQKPGPVSDKPKSRISGD